MTLPRHLLFLAVVCVAVLRGSTVTPAADLVDDQANRQTKHLFANLKSLAKTGTLFGHQSTLAYGVTWALEEGRSDVKDVTGSYPAVYGWDIGGFESKGLLESHVGYSKKDMLRWSRAGYERGGVITYAWHMSNPVTGESFYEKTPAVHAIIPGGEKHEWYKGVLDTVAEYFHELNPAPAIFRPFHEHNGDWFWWGKGFCTEAEYIALWRFTVDYLRDEKGVHNLLYAFSPDRSRMELDDPDAYFYAYPGDDYVDIIGLDNYWDVGHPGNRKSLRKRRQDFVKSLELIVNIAEEKGKIAALTETGLDTLSDPDWWTDVMLKGIAASQTTRRIAYLQVWRNANRAIEGRDHFYAPYPGHESAADFIAFRQSDHILFEDDIPFNLYTDKQISPKD